MIRLRILDILKEQNHSKYWLFKQMDLSYQNFNRMVQNETTSIKFENIEESGSDSQRSSGRCK